MVVMRDHWGGNVMWIRRKSQSRIIYLVHFDWFVAGGVCEMKNHRLIFLFIFVFLFLECVWECFVFVCDEHTAHVVFVAINTGWRWQWFMAGLSVRCRCEDKSWESNAYLIVFGGMSSKCVESSENWVEGWGWFYGVSVGVWTNWAKCWQHQPLRASKQTWHVDHIPSGVCWLFLILYDKCPAFAWLHPLAGVLSVFYSPSP